MSDTTVEKIETSLSSIEIAKNSKSIVYKVKVYDEDPYKAKEKATLIFDTLEIKYKDTVV